MANTVVVADEATARIFSADSFRSKLNEIKLLTNAYGRELEHEISTDLPGRIVSLSRGTHNYENEEAIRDHARHKFAKEVISYIGNRYHKNNLGHLVILASAEFLGELRKLMSPELTKTVILEKPNDLTKLSSEEIYQHLQVYYGRR